MRHSDEEHRLIAEQGIIIRCLVGSGVHGTAVDGQGDRDEMGVCVEPPEYVIGLKQFEQYIFRTQPEGRRSGPGDLDLTVYSLRKWMRLALSGNPTVLLPLFVPASEIVHIDAFGEELRTRADMVLSRQAGHRFLGYLRAQRDRLLGVHGGTHTNRPELVAKYGFDTKFAMHMVRLGVQGVELMETGRITLPIPDPWGPWLRDLRRGRYTKDEAIAAAAGLEARLEKLTESSGLPPEPDTDGANRWLVDVHRRHWAHG